MISQTSIHAIRAIMYLATCDKEATFGASHLAQQVNAPANYLGKILQQLTTCHLLRSQRGLGGGVRLAKDAEEISLFDIVEPIEHVSSRAHCFMNRLCCGPQPCRFHARWTKIHQDFIDFLKEVTVKDLVTQNKIAPETFLIPGTRKEGNYESSV